MKKIVSIILIFVLSLMLCFPVMAEDSVSSEQIDETDLFYFASTDPDVISEIESGKNARAEGTNIYIQNNCLEKDEVFDETQVTRGTDKVYADVKWTLDEYIAFLEADNKLEILQSKDVWYYSFPVYYCGEQVEDYMEILFQNNDGSLFSHISEGVVDYGPETYLDDRDKLIAQLAEDGITGYNILNAANFGGMGLLLAEKDGEEYVIINCHELYWKYTTSKWLLEREKELFEKRILTKDEVKQLFDTRKIVLEEYSKTPESKLDTADEMVSDKASFPWWIVGVAGAVIIAAGAAILIVLKKKKA